MDIDKRFKDAREMFIKLVFSDNKEDIDVRQYVKFVYTYIKVDSNILQKLDKFKILNKSDELALIAINNRLGLDVRETFFNLSKAMMKQKEYDESLFIIISDLNNLNFTSVEMDGNPKKHKAMILKNCSYLHFIYQDLAKFIFKPHCLYIKKELTDILQDLLSALDRVEVRIDSQTKSINLDLWSSFMVKEYKNSRSIFKNHDRGTDEQFTDLKLTTQRKAIRDAIRMVYNLLNFLQKMVTTISKEYRLIVKKLMNQTYKVIINIEAKLTENEVDVKDEIQNLVQNISSYLDTLKIFLFENKLTDLQEIANLKELAYFVATDTIVIVRHIIRQMDF